MSIIETKFRKGYVETPELRTNDIKSESIVSTTVNSNNVITDEIHFAGHNLEDVLFGDSVEETVIDPREIISDSTDGTLSYGAEQIIAFQMKVSQEYKGKYITSVTLRRCDTNTGSGKPVAQLEQVYLYANCMNSNEEVIDRFYSSDKQQQNQDDGLQTTWHFDEPIKISKDYEFIRFYCTRVLGEAQTDVNLRSSNIKIGNTKQYVNGWRTVDQASTKDFTTDFCVNVYQRTTGFLDHVNNNDIHVTAVDKERWDNFTVELNAGSFIEIGENNTISVKTANALSYDDTTVPTTKTVYLEMGYTLTDAQAYTDEAVTAHRNSSGLHTSTLLQNKWNNHVNDGTIHVTQTEKEKLNSIDSLTTRISDIEESIGDNGSIADDIKEVSDKIEEHIGDATHITTQERTNWNNKVDYKTFENKFDELQKFFDVTPKEKIRNTKDIFAKDGTGSAARIHAWDLKTAEFVGEYLTQVTIYRPTDIAYIDSSDILHNNPQRLSVECLDAEGNLLDTYFSNDADSQKDGDDNTTTWNFDEIIIKEEYNKLRFRVTTQGGVLENNPQSMKRAILCYTYTNIPDTNDWGLILQDNTIEAGHTMYFQFKTIIKQQNFAAHVVNADIHVTAEDKARWNSIVIPEIPEIPEPITYTAGNGIDITDNTISVITTDVIEESDKIPTAKALYNTFYGTRTFNNYDSSKYTESADTVGTIVLSKKHFIKEGKITKISLPHDKNIDNGEGGYLVIEVFAEDSSKTDGYDKANPIHRYYSDNYYAYKMNTQNGKYEWTFNDTECLIPSDYKVVHLSLVTNNTIVPSIGSANNNKLRINCLAKNGNRDEGVVYEEDDECTLYWKGSTSGANRVAIVQVEYIGNKLDDFSIVPMLLERIVSLEARINELENS